MGTKDDKKEWHHLVGSKPHMAALENGYRRYTGSGFSVTIDSKGRVKVIRRGYDDYFLNLSSAIVSRQGLNKCANKCVKA
jgi:hypothetical protein